MIDLASGKGVTIEEILRLVRACRFGLHDGRTPT